MNDQVFELDNYRGPLDLLLHLIREQELEILDVDLSRLCDQYLAALGLMRAVDINIAGEFLVLASTLVLIKSRSVLPREEEVDLEEELDPGDELIQQLLEYRKFKTLSLELGQRANVQSLRHGRGGSEVPPEPGTALEEIGLWDLVGSFVRLMEEIGLERNFGSLELEKPLRVFMREAVDSLLRGPRTLRDLVEQAGGGGALFGVFLAVLELVKTQQVVVQDSGPRDAITLALREDRDESLLSFLEEDLGAPRRPVVPRDDTSSRLAASDGDSIVVPLPPSAGNPTADG